MCILFRDALIGHWPIISRPIIRCLIPINTINLFSYLIQFIYLGSDCYPRTLTCLKDCIVQTRQKQTQKQSYKMHPLLPEMEATVMFVYFWFKKNKNLYLVYTYQLYKQQSADDWCICNIIITIAVVFMAVNHSLQWPNNSRCFNVLC